MCGCASVGFKQCLLFLSDGQELRRLMDMGVLVLMRRIYMPSFRFEIGYLEAKKAKVLQNRYEIIT
jgi:hypothetical protein